MEETKQITVLFGSPRTDGYTHKLLNGLRQQISADSYQWTILSAYELLVKPCIDCGACCKGVCPYNRKDSMELVITALAQANYIILASPVYFAGFPAPVKAIIDRMQQFFQDRAGNRSRLFHKSPPAFLLLTTGVSDKEVNYAAELSARMFFRCMNSGLTEKLILEGTDRLTLKPGEIPDCKYDKIVNYFG